jgi:hypothetical protein
MEKKEEVFPAGAGGCPPRLGYISLRAVLPENVSSLSRLFREKMTLEFLPALTQD